MLQQSDYAVLHKLILRYQANISCIGLIFLHAQYALFWSICCAVYRL
ncbi:hypothetical protein SALWKB12_2228 [Snodgrassella communis]|uniref:Uncharacterized protein n=1 Tax=Snodgrassella communis TaxID=2946699 RepID=A0A836MPM2_9NEIS|nr:hypothetical protein SALWKB12_2228 [Snodgrassella communis]KDN13847.1 hypothetical protein SALWKB29_2092 [Snodgrassella communis]